MGFLTTIRGSLVAISFTAIALILWLSVSFWYTAYLQKLDSSQLFESIETEDLLFESTRDLTQQRSLVNLMLTEAAPATDEYLQQFEALQEKSQVQFKAINETIKSAMLDTSLSERFTFVNAEISSINKNVFEAFNKLSNKQAWVVEQASLPLSERDTDKKNLTFNQFTALIESTQLLRWGTHFIPRHNELDIDHLQVLRIANWKFSEAIAKEASLISSVIVSGRRLSFDEKRLTESLHIETQNTWRALKQYTTKRGAIPKLNAAISVIEQQYFADFVDLRKIILSNNQPSDMKAQTLARWLSVEKRTTNLLNQLDTLNSQSIRTVAKFVEAKAIRNLIIDSSIVLICLLIGTAVIGVLRKIRHLATHDDLTGLPNRICFEGLLDTQIEHSENDPLAVLFLDLDGFKHVNDTLGHGVGDKLLQQVSDRMSTCIAKRGLVSRHGGDEFSVTISEFASKDNVTNLANQLVNVLSPDYVIDGFNVRIGASVGMSFYPEDAKTAGDLKRNADFAMYHAKSQGSNCIRAFDQEIASTYQQRLQLKDDLKQAIDEQQFYLVYQPQVGINANVVEGLEALIRWNHPVKGFISPEVFISIAEESGQILEIGDWVLDEACRQMAEWHTNGLAGMQIAVNVSAMQFMRQDFIEYVEQTCQKHALQPNCLELEITESVLVTDVQQVIDTCHKLRELKIKVAIDDFGTGYSSLSYLQELPVDTLKIDRAFVSGLDDITSKSVAKTIVTLAQSFGLETVAEGVETDEQADMIAELGCDYIQGYFYSKPVTAEELPQQVQSINEYCRKDNRAA